MNSITTPTSSVTSEDDKRADVSYPSPTELLITRDFAAPRDLVLAALTQPEHVRQWYGLTDDEMVVCDIDFRVGGSWHYVLAGAPGEDDYSFSGEYLEIDAPERFVSTERFDNIPGAEYVVTVTLTETGGGTRLQSHLDYPTREVRDGHLGAGMEGGMNIAYNRLEALLARLSS